MELKFRAYDPVNNIFHYADIYNTDEISEWVTWEHPLQGGSNTGVIWDITQFIGVKIHDADLYPGDIIKFDWLFQSGKKYAEDTIGVIGEVVQLSDGSVSVHHHGGLSFDAREINQTTYERFFKETYHGAPDCFQKMVNLEVIGNIHQHSHLLGGNNNGA